MTIHGFDYVIDIIGKNHDDYADGSGKAPLTFQMHDCYRTKYAMNKTSTNSGGWGACNMRASNLPTILKLMPTEIQTGIREVTKKYVNGSDMTSPLATVSDKLFLLAREEVFADGQFNSSEGTRYEYYANGGSRVKYYQQGGNAIWSLRSTALYSKSSFGSVYNDGRQDYREASYEYGVAFAFCF